MSWASYEGTSALTTATANQQPTSPWPAPRGVLCYSLESTHSRSQTETGDGSKDGGKILYQQIPQYEQCPRHASRSGLGNTRVTTYKAPTCTAVQDSQRSSGYNS